MSSILIKGVVMPLTCEECPCYDSNDYSCNVSGVDVAEYQYTGRPDDCPLVEVPTPHGRLIDADKLLESFREALNEDRCFVNFFALVDDSPTVIEAEESE